MDNVSQIDQFLSFFLNHLMSQYSDHCMWLENRFLRCSSSRNSDQGQRNCVSRCCSLLQNLWPNFSRDQREQLCKKYQTLGFYNVENHSWYSYSGWDSFWSRLDCFCYAWTIGWGHWSLGSKGMWEVLYCYHNSTKHHLDLGWKSWSEGCEIASTIATCYGRWGWGRSRG